MITPTRKNKFISFLCCITLVAGLLVGCSGSSSGSAVPGGYTVHTEVDGVTFAMPSSFTDSATAISEISEGGDFRSDIPYEFKNGKDTYIFFEMDSFLLICRKGTDFGFMDEEDKADCLTKSSILSVQLTLPQRVKKLDYSETTENGYYKFTGTVKAEAVITRNVYGDFVGKVASICIGNDEWTLFVGVPGTRYTRVDKNKQKIIEQIAATFSAVQNTDDSSNTDEQVESTSTDTEEPTSSTHIVGGGNTGSQTTTTVSGTNQGEIVVKEDNDEDAGAETNTGDADNTVTDSTEASESGESTAEDAENTEETDGQTADYDPEYGINMSSQTEAEEDGDAYISDIYSQLSVGQKGKAQVISDEANEIITVAVTLNSVTGGKEAIDTIKEYCASGEAGYTYPSPPTGTEWVVATYDIDYEGNPERPAVNSKLRGLDGKKLYLNGVGYSSRTYDMNYKASDGKNFMVYYAVPINCKEYSLVFGDGNTENLYQAAYYHVQVE